MAPPLTAPFPWFGGKSKVAPVIWQAFGDVRNYCEPFFGSGATLLQRPETFTGWAVVNDIDGHIANFWRAVSRYPMQVADHACSPVNEVELHARHLWLVNQRDTLTARLMADPDYCDTKAAGWWAWGCCAWIGRGWCSGKGPWSAVPGDDGIMEFRRNGGNGVNRQLPHLGNGGNGVNRQLPHLGNGGKGDRLAWLTDWCERLAHALRDVRVTCGDWERICSAGTMTRNAPCGVLLDPPYSQTAAVYACNSSSVSGRVRDWCLEHGGNPKLRMVLCGHAGEHEALASAGWREVAWKSHGYQSVDDRERLWLSPHCLPIEVERTEKGAA